MGVQKKQGKGLKLVDILVTIVIAVVFGIVYRVWGPIYDLLTPLGFHLDQMVYGMWFISATVAFLLIRKPGVALLAEVAAAMIEMTIGSEWGVAALLYGLLQGLGAELVFASFGYKKYGIGVTSLAAVASMIGSYILDFAYNYVGDLVWWNLILHIVARTVGSIVICGIFAYYLVKALEATGVTQLIRPATKEDYQILDQ